MAQLTLCVIAKDEEALLGGCLDSVVGLVDSIVVVDTGSSDRTAEVARARGAQVVAHAWTDDFAAARNAALAHVPRSRARYLLVLDADERLAPGAARIVRQAVGRADFDVGLLPLHDATALDADPRDVVAGRARRGAPVLLPRLLRWTDDLRWAGVVHEQPSALAAPGCRARRVDAPIVHLGAVPALREARGKAQRNRRLLERHVQAHPEDATMRALLAREHERAGDADRALAESRVAWRALAASGAHGAPRGDVVLVATLAAFLALRRGDSGFAGEVLAGACRWSPAHPNLELLGGLVHESRALEAADLESFARELASARGAYERLLALRGQVYASEVLPGACEARGLTRLATVLHLAGEPEAALGRFEEALRHDPSAVEAQLGAIEARIELGRVPEAMRALAPLLEGGTPDAWTLAACAAAALGQVEDTRLFAQRARETGRGTGWIGAWRCGRLRELEGALAEDARSASSAG